MKYVVYRWAKPTNRFEPKPHWALVNPNFYGVIVPEAYHMIVYAGMDPFTWANISDWATHLHRIILTKDEVSRCVVAAYISDMYYRDSFVRLDKFASALRFPFGQEEVLIPFAVDAEQIEMPPDEYECAYPETIPRPKAREGFKICSICKEEYSDPNEKEEGYSKVYICWKCDEAIRLERKRRKYVQEISESFTNPLSSLYLNTSIFETRAHV